MNDMVPFLIVLLSALIGFTISFRALNSDSTVVSYDFVTALQHNYRLMYGDFNVDDYTDAGWILFVVSSTLMALIMLNMLIAIMSDTYARVMGEIVPSDYNELNNMILE